MRSTIYALVLAFGAIWLFTFARGHWGTDTKTSAAQVTLLPLAGQASEATVVSQQKALHDRALNLLMDEGAWSKDACRAWWLVNERRLQATDEVAPELVEKELRLLSQMQPKAKVLRLLEEYPETAGILLLAFRKDALASAILGAPKSDQEMLVASYLFCTTGTEVDDWTKAVTRHPGPISLFQKSCAALPYHGLFSYLAASSPLQPDSREIYGKWLDEVLAYSIIKASDERLHSRLSFAATCGPEVRRRLQGDPEFRQNFLESIWPRFRDSMIDLTQSEEKDSQDVFMYCGGEPLIWDFFKRPDSKILFCKAGMDAVLLLEGPDSLRAELQKSATAMWMKGNLDLPVIMLEYQGNAHFLDIAMRLQAEKDWSMLNAVCLRLNQKGQQWPGEVAYLAGLRMPALQKEIQTKEPSIIPGAALVSLGARFVDGRRVGVNEWLGAGLDTVDLVTTYVAVAAVPVTGGGSIGVLAAKEAAKEAAKKTAKKATEYAIQQTLRATAKEGVEKLTGRAIKDLTKKQSTEWTQDLALEALKILPDRVRKTMIQTGLVEITAPVKTGFQLSRNLGLGREPFKKLTGLEARVFMRQDGRAFINFTNVIMKPSPAAAFLTRTLENGVLQSPPIEEGASKTAALSHQWKEDVSAWWTGHATGQFE